MRKHPFIGFKLLHDARQLSEESKTSPRPWTTVRYPTSDRPYRKKMAPFDALILMKKEMINHFQKDLYEKFVFMLM